MSATARRAAAALGLVTAALLALPAATGATGATEATGTTTSTTVGSEAPPRRPSAPAFTPTFSASVCPVVLPEDLEPLVSCGYVSVPLEHDEPAGATIELAVATFPATAPVDRSVANAEAPLVMLAGGPGELLVTPVLEGLASGRGALNPALHETRDFVLVDQRGVGASRPSLACPEVFSVLTSGGDDAEPVEEALPGAYAACRARLVGEGVDLSAFDTANAVEDVDMVRRALNYDQVHLFGTSYGARLALQVARAHPEGLASLVLSSPIPAEANFVADAGSSYDRVLRALDAACAADPTCAGFAPDLLASFEATLARLEAEPAQVAYADPVTGQETVIAIDGATLSQVVYSLLYAAGGPAVVPAVVAAAVAGDFTPLLVGSQAPATAPIAYGQQASFICAEEAVHAASAPARPAETLASQLFLSSQPLLGAGLERLCEIWDVEPGSAETFEPVRTDVPALVVTGQFDQITPPAYGEAVGAALEDVTYVEIVGVGHSPLFGVGPCGATLLVAFVADPGAPLDASCLPSAPTFLTPEQVLGPPPLPAESALVGIG